METKPGRAAREAVGCFLMLVLGALLALGVVIALDRIDVLRSGEPGEWLALVLPWLLGPAAGIGLIALALYGFKGPRGRR
jgi:hypothetical protein